MEKNKVGKEKMVCGGEGKVKQMDAEDPQRRCYLSKDQKEVKKKAIWIFRRRF